MKLSTIAFRNIRRNKRRSILSGSAIAIAVMSMVMLFALERGMMGDFMRNVKSFVTGSIRIRNARYSQNERLNPLHLRIKNYEKVMDICSQNENVAAISPRITSIRLSTGEVTTTGASALVSILRGPRSFSISQIASKREGSRKGEAGRF